MPERKRVLTEEELAEIGDGVLGVSDLCKIDDEGYRRPTLDEIAAFIGLGREKEGW